MKTYIREVNDISHQIYFQINPGLLFIHLQQCRIERENDARNRLFL